MPEKFLPLPFEKELAEKLTYAGIFFDVKDTSLLSELLSQQSTRELLEATDLTTEKNVYFGLDANSFYFRVGPGTPVLAQDQGYVVQALQGGVTSPTDLSSPLSRSQAHQNNQVKIKYQDGTIATYIHVLPTVLEGDTVIARQKLGIVGGFKNPDDPHLHLDYNSPNTITFNQLQPRYGSVSEQLARAISNTPLDLEARAQQLHTKLYLR